MKWRIGSSIALVGGVALLATVSAEAGNRLYWSDGSNAWIGSRGYHDDGSNAWTGSRGYHDDGSNAWTGSRGYHDDGSNAWTGSRCYHDNGSYAGSGSCSWSWGPGVFFTIIKQNGVAACTLHIAGGAVAVPCN